MGFHSVFYLGAENHGLGPGNFFRGSIDEFVFYRRALTSSEIALAVQETLQALRQRIDVDTHVTK